MNPYEIMLLLDPELADERQNEILTRARELVEQRGGTWQNQEPGARRKLAYEIDKKGEAIYHLLQFDCDAETLEELTRVLKITTASCATWRSGGSTGGDDVATRASGRGRRPASSTRDRGPPDAVPTAEYRLEQTFDQGS